MSKIKDILSIKLENDIKNVIDLNSQDENEIKDELDGFILTESLSKHLSSFLDSFCSDMKESGVWLSGFYGSGKSYFAKMLGFLIANPTIVGTPMRDRFMSKLAGLKNEEIIKNQITSLSKSDYHVVLFDSAKVDSSHGISLMAMSRFLLSLGLLDNWMGFLEYVMLIEEKYDKFLSIIKNQNGEDWLKLRKRMGCVAQFRQAVMLTYDISQEDYEERKQLIKDKIRRYDAATFREDLQSYLNLPSTKEKKIVFFIDEVSEALNQGKINLLDLEGLSEALSSLGNKVWTIGIAQQTFQDVLNSSGINIDLLNKVEARFKTRIPIAAEEIDIIIRRRLLTKTDEGKQQLQAYYSKNDGTIQEITNIAGISLQPTRDAEVYSDYYPFYEHQFKLLQYFLFGARNTVTSLIGTRGMLVSVFDVLKKEALTDEDVYTHVNAAQLCKQAEEIIPETLRIRYEQADAYLSSEPFQHVKGRTLLMTIHFLEKSNAHTTTENIARSYVRRLEQYYSILDEVKRALEILTEHNILIKSTNQYRITSQIEQNIINDMNAFDVRPYRAMTEVIKMLGQQQMIRICKSFEQDGFSVSFCVKMANDVSIANPNEKYMKIVFYDMFYSEDYNSKVTTIKQEKQNDKDIACIVPNKANATAILNLAKDLVRIDYIGGRAYATEEERRVVNTLVAAKEEKIAQLERLIREAYIGGTAIYLFNTYKLNDNNYQSEIKTVQRRMFGNIYTQWLNAAPLSDTLAVGVLKKPATKLNGMFGTSPEFQFFDTSGKFIGDNLSVVTAILNQCKSYISGKDLEERLKGPPTGFTFGTIMTTVAALFRGNKVIVKYDGEEYHSVTDEGAVQAFKQAKNFSKASFKAVLKSLTYNERQTIVEILKKNCHFKNNTGDSDPHYNLNDFEVVDHIRTLSRKMLDKVKDSILFGDEKEKLFSNSVKARDVFMQYTAAVIDANYIETAERFLENQAKYIKAVEQVERDLIFIDTEFKNIEAEREFIDNVIEEFDKTGIGTNAIQDKVELFRDARSNDLVANAGNLRTWAQDIKDIYYRQMCYEAEKLKNVCQDIDRKIQALKQKLDNYPKEWNMALYDRIAKKKEELECFTKLDIELNGWNVKCCRTKMDLRDITYNLHLLSRGENDVDIWEIEIATKQPESQPVQQQQTISQPKEHKMSSNMPRGKYSVKQYREWLKKQLSMVNQMEDMDTLNFDE